MRNTTKLKQLLLKYTIDLSMDEDGLMQLTLVDKDNGSLQQFAHKAYSSLVGKAHSFMLKELKQSLPITGKAIRSTQPGKYTPIKKQG